MKTKHFATIILASLLIVTVFGSVTVFAPPPSTPNPPTLFDAFITNTSDDPVPVDITDDSINVAVPDGVEITNTEPINVQVESTNRQPFHFLGGYNVPENEYTVPAGKRLVITEFSALAFADTTTNPDSFFLPYIQIGLIIGKYFMTTTQYQYSMYSSSDYIYYAGTHQVEIYVDPGVTLYLAHMDEPNSGVYNYQYNLAGYLEDIS